MTELRLVLDDEGKLTVTKSRGEWNEEHTVLNWIQFMKYEATDSLKENLIRIFSLKENQK